MKYPKLLRPGDIIGVCAPSSGVSENQIPRLDKAAANVKALGYDIIETASVRQEKKCVSADAKTRAAEFMELYENPKIAAIIPPWGGEFLMDILPLLDLEKLKKLPPKWISGYSDISTLTVFLGLSLDMAVIHGSAYMNMGYKSIHKSDLAVFDIMSKTETVQNSSERWGSFTSWTDISGEAYNLDKPTVWKSLRGEEKLHFEGRMTGSCMDTLAKLIGTPYAPVNKFLEKYKNDGFIWALESCEMTSAEIYRALWQMRECGWFKYCKGIIYGRPEGYSDTQDFTLTDALEMGLGCLNVPVLYDADIGHIPPQAQILNGSIGTVDFNKGNTKIRQIQNV